MRLGFQIVSSIRSFYQFVGFGAICTVNLRGISVKEYPQLRDIFMILSNICKDLKTIKFDVVLALFTSSAIRGAEQCLLMVYVGGPNL